VRDDHANEERAEQGVNPNPLRCQCREKRRGTNHCQHFLRGVTSGNLPPHKPLGSAAGDQQNEQDKSDCEKQGNQGVSGLRMSDSHEENKQAPGSPVVDRPASEDQHADGRFLQAPVREDASEHGKRGQLPL
jgi:hypothetical protein